MKTLVAVVTCERPGGVDYLQEGLESFEREGALGATERHIISDGKLPFELLSDLPVKTWDVHEIERSEGVRQAHWRAFWLAAALGVDKLLLLEDDARPCKNAITYALELEIPPDLAFISFFGSRESDNLEHGLYCRPCAGIRRKGFWGALALSFPKRTIKFLVTRDPFARRTDNPEAFDMAMGLELDTSPWPWYGLNIPCLFEHVGRVSNLYSDEPEGPRLCKNFAGYDFDAIKLRDFILRIF